MKILNIKTWDELADYLLERINDFNKETTMVKNPSITKEKYWNSLMGDCIKNSGKDLPGKVKDILLKSVKRNFGDNQ